MNTINYNTLLAYTKLLDNLREEMARHFIKLAEPHNASVYTTTSGNLSRTYINYLATDTENIDKDICDIAEIIIYQNTITQEYKANINFDTNEFEYIDVKQQIEIALIFHSLKQPLLNFLNGDK